MNFAEWFVLSDDERQSDQRYWHVLESGYWHSIAIEAAARFAVEFGGDAHVTQVFKSLYRARELIIAVQTDLTPPRQITLPRSYLGFRVMQFPGKIPAGILVQPGPPSELRSTKQSQPKPRRGRARTREVALGEHKILRLEGEIDFHRSPEIAAMLSDTIKERPEKLVLDISNMSYIDSSGLAALLNGLRKVGAYGGMLYLVGMQDEVRTIFETSRLDQVFRIFPDAAGALGGG